jgi:UDP-N-acetylmuramate: L-alanyl-gamma-D-glutamyl-meso-diaminopimelate ligase
MDLTNYWDATKLLAQKNSLKKIFFYRICGTGMGACAVLFKEKGFQIAGADTLFYPPMGDYLKKTGIPLHEIKNVDEKLLKQFDLIVVGNVVPKASDDARIIESCGVPFTSFPTAMGSLVLKDINVIGIAGTHGKTTTTYLITQLFEKLGEKPGYFIGGVLDDRPSSRLGDGKYFFIESDEYDSAYFEKFSKFRNYQLDSMILTSLEFDHADIYQSLEQIEEQFGAVIPHLSDQLIACSDYANIDPLIKRVGTNSKITWFGSNSEIGPKTVRTTADGTEFTLKHKGAQHSFKSNMIGEHNIANLATAIIYALEKGFTIAAVSAAIQNLKMVKRRQEVKGYYRGMTVIDDFAHHPRAVKLTLAGIKSRFPNKKIVALFDPASATARSSIFQQEFLEALKEADEVLMTKPERATSVKWATDIDPFKMTYMLNAAGVKSIVVENLDNILTYLQSSSSKDKVFIVLSNGACMGLWKSDFMTNLDRSPNSNVQLCL